MELEKATATSSDFADSRAYTTTAILHPPSSIRRDLCFALYYILLLSSQNMLHERR